MGTEELKARIATAEAKFDSCMIVYVRASSLKEAWPKVRADDAFETSDSTPAKSTFRRLPNQDDFGES